MSTISREEYLTRELASLRMAIRTHADARYPEGIGGTIYTADLDLYVAAGLAKPRDGEAAVARGAEMHRAAKAARSPA